MEQSQNFPQTRSATRLSIRQRSMVQATISFFLSENSRDLLKIPYGFQNLIISTARYFICPAPAFEKDNFPSPKNPYLFFGNNDKHLLAYLLSVHRAH